MNAVRAARNALERGIVEHDRHLVGRQLHVEFKVADAEVDGGRERLQGVLRILTGVAAVSDDFRQGVGGHDGAGWETKPEVYLSRTGSSPEQSASRGAPDTRGPVASIG